MPARLRGVTRWLILAAVVAGPRSGVAAQGTDNGEWRSYGGDIANTRYSPLDQITRENVHRLEPAWRYDSGALRDAEYVAFALPPGAVPPSPRTGRTR